MAGRVDDAAVEWDRVVATLDRDPADGLNIAWECCERWAADRGRLALIVRDADGRSERYTYFELARHASRAAGAFAAAGLRRGDKIAAVLSRQVEAWASAFGAWRSGLVYVPLFCGFGAEALAQRLNAAEVDAVIVDARWRDAVEAARPLLARDPVIFTVTGDKGEGLMHGDRSFWAELMRSEPDLPALPTAAEDPAIIMFTSGTTSVPKGCVIPHSGLVSLLPWVDHSPALDRSHVLFTTTDPGWSYGLLTTGAAPMARGISRVMYTGDFDPRAWFDVIHAEQVTHVAAVPTAFRALVAAGRRTGIPSCLRGAVSAGEPLDEDTARGWFELTGTQLRDGYGQTELGMVLADLEGDAPGLMPGSLSGVVPGWDAGLMDDSGQIIEGAGEGQLVVRRPRFQLSSNYTNAPDLWTARWRDEWFQTHDVARRDESGRWWFVGRDDDVIVTAGYNVGPGEIEAVLVAHPAVADAAVVAAPDTVRGGIAVRAVVVLDGAAPSEALTKELQDAVRTGIGRHAYPRIVDYVSALPRTETGKLRRGELRKHAAEVA